MKTSNHKKLSLVLLGVFVVILFSVQGAMGKGECENPETLTFAIVPTADLPTLGKMYDPVLKHISNVTGKKIDFYMPTSYGSVAEAMLRGWVDFARLGPFAYTIAHERSKGNVKVFGSRLRIKGIFEGAGVGYHCILITKKGSGLETVKDLKKKVLALVDPASTSGSLVPEVLFSGQKLGGTPLKKYFGKVFYSGGHDLSVLAVVEGRADAAFVAAPQVDRAIDRKLLREKDIHEIWRSIFIPQDAYAYKQTLCPELKKKIEKAWLTMHEYEPARPFLDFLKCVKYVPMKDSDYDVIRELAEAKAKKKK